MLDTKFSILQRQEFKLLHARADSIIASDCHLVTEPSKQMEMHFIKKKEQTKKKPLHGFPKFLHQNKPFCTSFLEVDGVQAL